MRDEPKPAGSPGSVAPIKDFKLALSEMFEQSQRAGAIVAVALLDELLERCLYAFLKDERKRAKEAFFDVSKPLSSFKAKVDAGYLLGILDSSEYSELEIIRKIRNEFAHNLTALSFESPDIKALSGQLRTVASPPGFKLNISPFDRFKMSTTCLAYRLDSLSTKLPKITDWSDLKTALERPENQQ